MLKHVLREPITDGPHETPEFLSSGRPFLSVDAIQNGELKLDGCRYISEEAFQEYRKKAAPAVGDLLMGKAASVGKIARVKTDTEFSIWSPLALIRLNTETIASGYMEYVLKSSALQQQIDDLSTSNTQKNIGMGDIPRLEFARPPINEQIAIAAYLDAETKRIDDLVGEKRKLFTALTELKKSIVTEAITLGIDKTVSLVDSGLEWAKKIPAGWRVASLKRFVKLIGGHTPSTTNPSYWDGDVPWFSPKDMKSDELKDSIDHVTCSAVEETGLSVIESKTTMIVVRGMILAHTFPVCVTQVPGTLNQDMKALIPDESIEPTYLPWLLRGVAPLFLSLTDQSGHGTLALRTDRFMSEALPVPPKTVQLEIISFIETERKKLDDLLAHVHKEIDLLIEMRAATITDAVLGRIDVRKSQTH